MSLTRFHCANSLGLRGAGATRVYTPLQKIKAGLNKMTGTGFEPVPPKRLVPETSALDRSATQPRPVARPVARARAGGHQVKPPRGKKKILRVPYGTRDSHVVPHRSTDRAQRRLTSEF